MKLKSPWIRSLIGRVAAKGIRTWMSTIRYESLAVDRTADPVHPECQPSIFVHWHENMLIPLYLRGNCHVAILVSQHRDADILETFARHSGFDCVRGSSYRGGASALRDLMERGKHQHMVLTPDGPRGPRRKCSQGAIYLASKLGQPITPLGMAFDNAWYAKSWDRFAVPKPFSTARVVMGEPIPIAPNLDRDQIKAAQLLVESKLNELNTIAEEWAKSREKKPEMMLCHRPSRQIPPITIRDKSRDETAGSEDMHQGKGSAAA